MFFSGVGRQPISASPVLFLANEGWITWLQCCRLCEQMRVKTPHQTRIHVSLSLNTIESLFDLAKYRFWSGEAIPGVRRPVFITHPRLSYIYLAFSAIRKLRYI
jgi:hypothetical protein